MINLHEERKYAIQLWNQLTGPGDLNCSATWYATREQGEKWVEISKEEFADPKSNANREMRKVRAYLTTPEMQKAFEDSLHFISVGVGTGRKATEIIDFLPSRDIHFLRIDSSEYLLDYSFQYVEAFRDRSFNYKMSKIRWDSRRDSFQNFMKAIERGDYSGAFEPTRDSLKYIFEGGGRLEKKLKRIGLGDEIPKLKYIRTQCKKYSEALDLELANLDSDEPAVKRKLAVNLRQKYNPCLFNNISSDICRYNSGPDPSIDILRWKKSVKLGIRLSKGCIEKFANPKDEQASYNLIDYGGMHIDLVQGKLKELEYILEDESTPKIPKLITMLGQTLGNFNKDDQRMIINRTAELMKKGDYLLLGVELLPEKKSPAYKEKKEQIRKKYASESAQQFIRSTLQLLKIPLDSVKFGARWDFDKYSPNLVGSGNAVEMYVQVKKDIEITHPERHLDKLVLKKHREILLGRSYKFPIEEIEELVANSGLELEYGRDQKGEEYWVGLARK